MAIKYREEALPKVATFPFDITHWAGVNRLEGGQHDYEMSDCTNMSADNYPYASPRKARKQIIAEQGIQRIYKVEGDKVYFIDANDCLCYVENGEKAYVTYTDEEDVEQKIQMPDCTCTNNYDKGTMFYPYTHYLNEDNEFLSALYRFVLTGGARESTAEELGDIRLEMSSGYIPVENPKSNKFRIKVEFPEGTNAEFDSLIRNMPKELNFYVSRYNEKDEEVEDVKIMYRRTTYTDHLGYVQYSDPDKKEWEVEFAEFNEGDHIKVEYVSWATDNLYMSEYEDLARMINSGEWYVSKSKNALGNPCVMNLEYGTVYNNRIVGVKGSEIRASALGDLTNFWEYADEAGNPSATGAYATNVGSAGDFTGICVYNNMIVLFKKDLVYEMYGSMPYTIMELCTTGCIDNDSICEIGGVLYWASPKGIVRYSGGMPAVISHMVDIDTSGICKAGTDGRKYYVYDGKKLYVYDTYYQLWHIEKAEDVKMLYRDINTVYILCNDGIYKINEGDEAVEWEFETKDFTFQSAERKNLSKLWIRTQMEKNSHLEVYVRQDGKEWERKAVKTAERDEMFDFKLRIKKCDSFAIKFKGRGDVKILDLHGKVTVGTSKHRSGASLNVYR